MKDSYHFYTIKKSIEYLAQNYQSQPSLDELAEHSLMSKYHFHKIFQSWAGVSPKVFLQHLTTEHAKRLLSRGRSTLDTAYDVGLSGNGRLHDLFVKVEACSPGEFKKRGEGLHIAYDLIETPFGSLLIAETEKGICQASFEETEADALGLLKEQYAWASFSHKLGKYGQSLRNYFHTWEVPSQQIMLSLRGTPFQVKVWQALLKIPSGHLLSYKDMAIRIQQPKASRAVGSAIGKNPIAFLIPCHRVIRENGMLSGYRWGSHRKQAIIGFESVSLNPEGASV